MTNAQQKKWRLLRTYLARHPLWCTWQVTYRCDFRCSFCHYWCDKMAHQPEQTVDDFARGSAKLARWGTLLISLAGGEPLLRDDIVDVVQAVGRWHFPFITTNGYHVDEKLARELFNAGLWGISVSIDYADADKHDHARGVQNAYNRAVKALETFSGSRCYPWQRVNLMMVLLNDNLDQVEPLLQLAGRYDAYLMIQPYSVLKTGSAHFRYQPREGISQYLLNLKQKYPNFLSNQQFLSKFDVALDGGIPNCAAGKAFFNIDSTGEIAICVEKRDRAIANLYNDEITTIGRRLRQKSMDNRCQQCWYNCRGEVESLYHIYGLYKSLPTWIFNWGRPSSKGSEDGFSRKSLSESLV